jgi:hypothetical protein
MEPMKDSRSRSRQFAAYIAMLPFWLALEAMEAVVNQTGIDRKFIQKSREDWAVNGLRSLYGERDATRYYVAGSKSIVIGFDDGFFTRADCETHTYTHRPNGE